MLYLINASFKEIKMELSPKQQTTELIKKSQNILLLSPRADGDSLGALLALYFSLKKFGKDPVMVCPEVVPSFLTFLPHVTEIKKDLSVLRDFIISLDCGQAQVAKLGYHMEGDKLKIIVTPQKGKFSSENISTIQGAAGFDLIIIVDSADLDLLGTLYDDNAEIFYKTPVINIDHHASNDYYGKINLVDLTSTSTCEILVSIIEALAEEKSIMDEDIATALLTGIITDTGNFQNSNTTPKSFTVAAQLIAQGGRQQEIIKYIYKTKPLSTLRLWGRILAQIREDLEHKFIWSLVTLRDLEQTGARDSEISGAIDDLLTSAPGMDIVLLLSEREDGIHGSIRTTKGADAVEIAKMFGGGGHSQAAAFNLKNIPLAAAEKEIIEKVRAFQQKRIGPSS